jgi:hypothetical protein
MTIGIKLGRVDDDGAGAIETAFWPLPMIPLASSYRVTGAEEGPLAIRIPLDLRSVVLGYARVLLPLYALGVAALALGGSWKGTQGPALLAAAVGLGVIAWRAFTIGGRLSQDERRRRRLLAAHTGLGIDPRKLGAEQAADVYANLAGRWARKTGSRAWVPWIGRCRGARASLLFALTSYAAAVKPSDATRELAERAWGHARDVDVERVEREQGRAKRGVEPAEAASRRSSRERSRSTRAHPSAALPLADLLRAGRTTLTLRCPSGGRRLTIAIGFAGKAGRCGGCLEAMRVPRPERLRSAA